MRMVYNMWRNSRVMPNVTSPKHLHASPRDRTASGLRNVTPTLNKPKDPIYSFAVTVLY